MVLKIMAKEAPDVFELLKQLEELKPKAIDDLLAQRAAIDAKLASLGYVEAKPAPAPPKPKKTAPKASSEATDPSANYDPEKTCNVCNGAKGHDGRAHRSQNPKAPFTNTELQERGLLPSA